MVGTVPVQLGATHRHYLPHALVHAGRGAGVLYAARRVGPRRSVGAALLSYRRYATLPYVRAQTATFTAANAVGYGPLYDGYGLLAGGL